ncbi:hypothetical protein DVH24_040374 [Malus domestica]|uniref:Uncharacterized protein n=1 Tax=Malus domestica TaxID=3750 RepID=A0A498IB48_MALDO|nr:hypothetical protein DVH24_040374 [Malus domestica]
MEGVWLVFVNRESGWEEEEREGNKEEEHREGKNGGRERTPTKLSRAFREYNEADIHRIK